MNFLNDLIFFLPEIYMCFGLMFVLINGVYVQKYSSIATESIKYSSKYTLGMLFPLLALLFFQPKYDSALINALFINNQVAFFSKLFVVVLFLSLSISFLSYYKSESSNLNFGYEYPVLMLLALVGMFFLISSNDFLILFLGIELQSLSLYVLAASKKNTITSLESGLKYFVLGAFSSGIILFGISFLYGSTGMTNFNDLRYFLLNLDTLEESTFYICLISFSFILVGLLFKLPAAPFHSWAPDVYTGSPTAITAFFSIIPKIAIFTVLIKLVYTIFLCFNQYWSFFLLACSIASFVIGSLGALYNTNLKRLMAYGTINHIGFMLLALSTVSVEGVQASLFYLTIYLTLNLNFFTILLSFRKIDDKRVLFSIADFSTLFYKEPVIAVLLIFNLFSMAGIPPLSGFFSKFYVVYCSMNSGMIFASLFAVLVSVISCFYYIRMVKISMFEYENNKSVHANTKPVSDDFSFVIVVTSLFNLLLFINPNFLLSICYSISHNLFL